MAEVIKTGFSLGFAKGGPPVLEAMAVGRWAVASGCAHSDPLQRCLVVTQFNRRTGLKLEEMKARV